MTTPIRAAAFILLALSTMHSAAAEDFTKEGLYSVDVDGWQHGATPNGDGFQCTACSARVQIQIEYSPPLPSDAKVRTEPQFLASLKTEMQQKAFAEQLLRHSIPAQSDFRFAVVKTGTSKVGGLEMLDFTAIVDLPPTPTHDRSLVAIHKDRLLKLTINYYEGSLDAQTNAGIEAFLKKLKFAA